MERAFRLGLAVMLVGVMQLAARAADPIDRLRTHITQAMTEARGRMGVAIKHLESGTEIVVNADEKFPMASTFKLPVLVTLYDRAKKGQVKWDETVDVGVHDQHLGSGDLSYLYDVPGVKLSLHNVANLMMMVSDNSGADICLTRAGADNVNALMSSLGAGDIHVDRPTQELILDYQGRDTARLKGMTLAEIQKAAPPSSETTQANAPQANAIDARFARDEKFAADSRDQATPKEDAMTEFTLGMNTCFAVKRWPEPEEWARIIAEDFGLKSVQFSFDLMDPRAGSGVVASYIDHTRIECARYGLSIHSTFTGFLPFMNNLLLHPEPAFRDDAKAWFKAAIEVTARMKVSMTGGYFGALSMKDVSDANRRQERMDGWLDGLRELAQEACTGCGGSGERRAPRAVGRLRVSSARAGARRWSSTATRTSSAMISRPAASCGGCARRAISRCLFRFWRGA